MKREVFGNVPTIFVFTKYDKLLDYIEGTSVDVPINVEQQAEDYLKRYCIGPIQQLTKEHNIPPIAVTMRRGFQLMHERLIEFTFQEVSECFTAQLDESSPVPVVTTIAQRMVPSLKIEGPIQVGRRRYRRALASNPNFRGYTIWDCLGVIHTDIVSVWNFHDPSGGCRRPNCIPPTPSANFAFVQDQQRNRVSAAFRPIKLPYDAGLVFVNWVYNTYQRLPVVQQIFMAYIVDLAHVLKTLFTFTAGTNEKRLTRRPIKASFNTYNSSQFRRYVHIEVKVISNAGNRDVVLEKIESLVRADNGLTPSLPRVTNVEFDEDEAWHTSFDGT
ncbi:hypothetical protein J3A83DRAFT_4372032 [Scleroderma citrinum]